MSEEEQIVDDSGNRKSVGLKIWPIEKLRIWLNLVLGAVVLIPFSIEILAGNRYRSTRTMVSEFVFEVLPHILMLFVWYNLFFSVIYLFEKSSIGRKGVGMDSSRRNTIFSVILAICLFHLLLKMTGKL